MTYHKPYKVFSRNFGADFPKTKKQTIYHMLWGRKHNKPFGANLFFNNFY